MSTLSQTFTCAACEQPASVIQLLTDGRLRIDGGPVSMEITTTPGQAERIGSALAASDAASLFAIHFEYAPFWCPDCPASYCSEHYRHWDVRDEGFFDCTRGVCPNGHERMLID